jgi:tetratricopeptide (TPR) repeat protein
VVAYQEGNLAAAERSWKESSRLDPKDGRSRNNLGVLAQAQGKHQEALLHFQMAAKLVPENPAYLLNESWELLALGRKDTARKQLLRIQRLSDQRHDVGFLALALLSKLDGKWEVAVTHCDSCLKRNPEYTQAWLLKGEALEQLKKPAEALESYKKAVESDPNVKEADAAAARLEKALQPATTPTSTPTPKP